MLIAMNTGWARNNCLLSSLPRSSPNSNHWGMLLNIMHIRLCCNIKSKVQNVKIVRMSGNNLRLLMCCSSTTIPKNQICRSYQQSKTCKYWLVLPYLLINTNERGRNKTTVTFCAHNESLTQGIPHSVFPIDTHSTQQMLHLTAEGPSGNV